jgi:hypothetical protein
MKRLASLSFYGLVKERKEAADNQNQYFKLSGEKL